MMSRLFLRATVVALLLWPLALGQASAHGIVGGRYDLPVPLWLYLYGAGTAVVLSFTVLGAFAGVMPSSSSYPRYDLFRHRWLRSLLTSRWFLGFVRLVGVGLLLLVGATGLFGESDSVENFAPVFVWVIWWIGMGFVVALAGNVWTLLNPWRTLFGWAEALYKRVTGRDELSRALPYPAWLGVWPAFLQFLVFIWVELAYDNSADPFALGVMATLYSAMTLLGMFLFGKHVWLRHGEVFSVYFDVLAKFAPTEVRVPGESVCEECSDGSACRIEDDGCVNCYECVERVGGKVELNLRPWAIGLSRSEKVTVDRLAFVVFMLSSVTFDGFKATGQWARTVLDLKPSLSTVLGNDYITGAETLGIAAFLLGFLALYLGFSYLVRLAGGRGISYGRVAYSFLYSLVPIALVYNMAHYWTFLATIGQRIVPLLSDPFGYGWDLLGTASVEPNYGIINATMVWYTQVVLIIVGHVAAVFLAHLMAGRLIVDQRRALLSQVPMLGLMVIYTVSSLWILAQDIVE